MNGMINRDGLLALYSYNAYANKLVLDTVEKLAEEELRQERSPSHGSVLNLLVHMMMCEASFLARCQGKALEGDESELSTLAGVRRYWSQLEGEQLAYIGSLGEGDLGREIEWRPRNHLLILPIWQLLTQALVHSIHHRGELSIVLTALGYPLPTLDIILHFIEQSGQKWPFE